VAPKSMALTCQVEEPSTASGPDSCTANKRAARLLDQLVGGAKIDRLHIAPGAENPEMDSMAILAVACCRGTRSPPLAITSRSRALVISAVRTLRIHLLRLVVERQNIRRLFEWLDKIDQSDLELDYQAIEEAFTSADKLLRRAAKRYNVTSQLAEHLARTTSTRYM
jgi:hypothetical protein